jgi:hypothetical protein
MLDFDRHVPRSVETSGCLVQLRTSLEHSEGSMRPSTCLADVDGAFCLRIY